MKTLIVYIKEGQLVFTQTNAIKQYSCIVEDVEENKELTDKILDLKAGSRTCAKKYIL